MAFPVAVLGMLARPTAVVLAALKLMPATLSRRRVLHQLGQLDDRMLRDIGITRQDVVSAWAEPLFRDPTIQLVERAHEGRMAARAAARERLDLSKLMRAWDNENRHAA